MQIIINKVPGKRLYSGSIYSSEGGEIFCSACRGILFPTKKFAKEFLTSHAKISKTRSFPDAVIDTINFTYKKEKYRLQYFLNNNFIVSRYNSELDKYERLPGEREINIQGIRRPHHKFGGLFSYYRNDGDKFPKRVRNFLDETAASFRAEEIIIADE